MTATTGSSKANNGYRYSLEGDSLSQDLHFKMSKKIAQLTKVIYVLNTRNDEHDMVLDSMTNQHKREMRQTVSEVNERVEAMESRLKAQTGDQQRVVDLQNAIRNYENLLEQTKAEFNRYREDVSVQSKERDEQHMGQLRRLNDKIESLEVSYRELLESGEGLQHRIEADRESSLREAEARHEGVVRELKTEFCLKERRLEEQLGRSKQELEAELGKAREHIQSAAYSKERSIGQYEQERIEMREGYEQERRKIMEGHEMERCEMRESYERRLAEAADEAEVKLRSLQQRLTEKEESTSSLLEKHLIAVKENEALVEESKKEMEVLRVENKDKTVVITKCMGEVETMRRKIEKMNQDLIERQRQHDGAQKAQEDIHSEMQHKTRQIADLKSSVEAAQQKLVRKETELRDALQRIEAVSQENKDMEHCTKSVSVDYEIQMQTLKRGLEELMNEKTAQRHAFERLHLNHEIEQGELQNRLRNEHNGELEKMTKKLEKEYSTKEKGLREEIQKLKEEHQVRLEDERSKASKMIDKFKAENEQIKTDSNSKIKTKDKQISVHEASISEKDKEIKGVTLQNKSLKESVTNLKKENNKLTYTITEKDTLIEKLTADVNQMKDSLDGQILENERIQKMIKTKVQEDMTEKYNQLSADLDKKWADTLRRETGRIRNDMLDSFAKEKEKFAENIERMKNEEITSIQNDLDGMKLKFLSEISLYKENISKLESQLVLEKEEVNKYSMEQIQSLKSRLEVEEKSHVLEMSKLNETHKKQIDGITRQYEKDRLQYVAHMEALLEATNKDWNQRHETKVNSLNRENEQTMKRKLEEMMNDHNREMNNQVMEMQVQMTEAQQDVMEDLRNQIKSLQQKVHFSEDQVKVQADHNRSEMEKAKVAKFASDQNYDKLERNIQEIVQENDYLKKQLEEFSDEYNRGQKEFTEKIKQKENDLKNHYEQIMQSNKLNYEEDSRQTLQDFNKAQNLFKDKIKELSSRLLETEERFLTRPSRDQDVEMIDTLRAQLRSSEKEIERMNEEKKFIQLELKNRETNFNKIFNASPNVGKVDPAGYSAIKTKKVSADKVKNIQKLTPLPGSPFHDDPINPARPLPPPRTSIDAS